jgi:hypothetical protein
MSTRTARVRSRTDLTSELRDEDMPAMVSRGGKAATTHDVCASGEAAICPSDESGAESCEVLQSRPPSAPGSARSSRRSDRQIGYVGRSKADVSGGGPRRFDLSERGRTKGGRPPSSGLPLSWRGIVSRRTLTEPLPSSLTGSLSLTRHPRTKRHPAGSRALSTPSLHRADPHSRALGSVDR